MVEPEEFNERIISIEHAYLILSHAKMRRRSGD